MAPWPRGLSHRRRLGVAGCALLAAAVMRWTDHYTATGQVGLVKSDHVVSISTDHPSEAPAPADYQVAPDAPRQLSLPSIRTQGLIQPVGIDQYGAMAVPQNIHMAGWYVHGVRPGDAGLSIIDGHVSGRYVPGIFANLTGLKQGEVFMVQYGDKSERRFRVKRTAMVTAADASSRLYEKEPSVEAQLNLITCAGSYDTASHRYDQRLIVVAERI